MGLLSCLCWRPMQQCPVFPGSAALPQLSPEHIILLPVSHWWTPLALSLWKPLWCFVDIFLLPVISAIPWLSILQHILCDVSSPIHLPWELSVALSCQHHIERIWQPPNVHPFLQMAVCSDCVWGMVKWGLQGLWGGLLLLRMDDSTGQQWGVLWRAGVRALGGKWGIRLLFPPHVASLLIWKSAK